MIEGMGKMATSDVSFSFIKLRDKKYYTGDG